MASFEFDTSATSISEEILKIKEKYGSKNCRIIKNMGEFSHIITIKLNDESLTVKFQVKAQYPDVTPEIIVLSSILSKDGCGDLTNKLFARSIQLQGSYMLTQLLENANNFMLGLQKESKHVGAAIFPGPNKHEQEPLQQRQLFSDKRKAKVKKHKPKSTANEETVNEKLASMKTAEDVISRILWDESLNMEDFVIGYLDRFLGVVEKNFTAFSWEDLASVDWSTLAIPKHRIQHFKYKSEVIWDKNIRKDNMFGSTGSGQTIYKVIANYKEEQFADAQDEGKNSDDDDDNIFINCGSQEIFEEEEEDYPEEKKLVGKDAYWGPKCRPTHFLCLRVNDPQIKNNVTEAQRTITSINEAYEEFIIPPEKLHITLCCLGLDTDRSIERAAEALKRIQPELQQLYPDKIELSINGINNFFHNVLYAEIEKNEKLFEFVHHLKLLLQESGIEIRDLFDYLPHMTICKLSKDQKRGYFDSHVYDCLEGTYFGQQVFDNIYLCQMSRDTENGFYVNFSNISL